MKVIYMIPDNYLLPFPRRFRLLIDETKTSQQELADYIGVSRQAIAQWKDGKTVPDVYNFVKIAEFFNVPYDYLLGKTESRFQENIKLSNDFKLSDRAINRLLEWAFAAKENKTDIPRYEIISDLLSSNDFEAFIDCIRKFISEYLGHRLYEDEQLNQEVNFEYPLDPNPHELDLYARTIGYRALSASDFSDLFRHQAIEVIGRILSFMPEDYYIEYKINEEKR